MLNIVVSLMLAVIAFFLTWQVVPGGNIPFAILAALVVGIGAFYFIMRHFLGKVGALGEIAQADLQANRVEKALAVIKSGYRYSKWILFGKAQINAQVGSLYFIQREFRDAFPYLQKAFVRHWSAMGMLGVCYMKRQQTGKMIETFEKAVVATKKEALLWNLYAFCLDKVGEHGKAVAVMERGIAKCGADDRLVENLDALKNGRKMKMKGYGDMWHQFHLEKMGALIKRQTKAVTGRRKMPIG